MVWVHLLASSLVIELTIAPQSLVIVNYLILMVGLCSFGMHRFRDLWSLLEEGSLPPVLVVARRTASDILKL